MELHRRALFSMPFGMTAPENAPGTSGKTKNYRLVEVNQQSLALMTQNSTPIPQYAWNHTGAFLNLPTGVYDVYQTITLGNGSSNRTSDVNALSLTGVGSGPNEAELSNLTSGVLLRWRGPDNQPMIRVNGPIWDCRIENLTLDCARSANGIEINHGVNCFVKNIQIRGAKQFGVKLQGTAPPQNGVAVGCGKNHFQQIDVFIWNDMPDENSGFIIGAENAQNIGCSNNVFDQCSVLGGAYGFQFRFCDYIKLNMCQSYYSRVSGFVVKAPPDLTRFPCNLYPTEWSSDTVPKVLNNWTVYEEPGVIFTNYHREWNGGNPMFNSSYGPPFPNDKRFQGTDNLGQSYNIRKLY